MNIPKLFICCIFLIALTATVLQQTVPVPSASPASAAPTPTPTPQPAMPEWTAPVPRDKVKTIFAPKPTEGDNIFKGEREAWLADAIVKLETGALDPVDDKDLADYVTRIGQNLAIYSAAPKTAYQFTVLKDCGEDAFNIGDGRVYITLGILKMAENEDEVAGIIAHEMGHDSFRHTPKTATRQLFWMKGTRKIDTPADAEKAITDLDEAYRKNAFAAFGENLLGWSRFQELEADKAAFYNSYKAGYNPWALADAFRRFIRREKAANGEEYPTFQFLTFILGSHPPSSQRLTAIKWEALWVKMPAKEARFGSPAFDAMKVRMTKQCVAKTPPDSKKGE